ncbi:PAS/PAC sensor signal transduction histidine kinase [Leptothrix cholodnii SP-6]|uniref:histidine kinase n=1 Tax=Leptothrix cholodnii (strain ATCC 51168 / LMG 8142 / SP-6) TaxID=395495 RepID=B1XYJ2_LEPCP|nr:PAS domain S-box protein [Leptothrix cholodnii]ACB36428.1 PAS/PAC sensor signal transduction histidine kinase [Leptothrix cholodnii SP-6]
MRESATLDASIDDLPDACFVLSSTGIVLQWNAGAEEVFGHSAAQALGHDLIELVVPDDQAGPQRAWLATTLAGGPSTCEAVRRRRDGSLLCVDVTSRMLPAPPGQPARILVVEKDVTLIKVQRDAKLMEARFRELLESTPDGIVMVNPTGHIVIANSQAERLFGYPPGGLRGRSVDQLLPERYRHAHVAHRSQYFLQPRKRAMGSGLDLAGLRRDGTEFPIEISLGPLRTEDGAFVMSAIRDISERKRFERALQEKNVELAAANEAKTRFLANMSHELRTPLNAIIGFTGTLLMRLPGPLTPDQERQLRTVQASGRHLLALINDLLDVAKIEAGKAQIHLEMLDVGALLHEVVSTLHPQAVAKGLALTLSVPEPALQCESDRRMLNQIVINLIGNAIKFTDAGSIHVGLRARAGGFEIEVTDTGIGIGTDDQAKLFGAFSRVVSSQGRVAEGTGLGLHLSQKLAALLGGTIDVRSEAGRGSCFSLRVPGG